MKNNVKKLICVITSSALLLAGLGMHTFAKEITIKLDGETVECPTPARIENGSTMVPMRAIFEALGMKVEWNNETQTVTATKGDKVITLTIGEYSLNCNGESVELNVAPFVENGSTMVPVRAVSESVDATVKWNSFMKQVEIITEGLEIDPDAWKENTGTINLTDLSVTGLGAYVEDNVVYITDGGDFEVTGENENAMIYVNAIEKVKLRLSGIKLTNPDGPAIFFDNTEKAFITISKGTENYITDGQDYNVEAKAAIFANDDIEIKGAGTLNVVSKSNHAIASDDDIKIEEGTIILTSNEKDGIHANNTIKVTGGSLNITAKGDGIQSEEDILVEGGEINIVTNGTVTDGTGDMGNMGGFGGRGGQMRQQTQPVAGGENNAGEQMPRNNTNVENMMPPQGMEQTGEMFKGDRGGQMRQQGMENQTIPENMENMTPPQGMGNQTSPQGMGNIPPQGMENMMPQGNMGGFGQPEAEEAQDTTSTSKGIKAETDITISGGVINVNSADDAMHCGGTVTVSGGEVTLNSNGGKGISSHGILTINDGTINVTKATEGLESKADFIINGGTISVTASDDGINAGGTGGRDTSANSGHDLTINNGTIYVNASGDGVDANGAITINGGSIVVDGPTNNGNGALDAGSSIEMNAGTLIAVGASGMAEVPGGKSAQPSLQVITTSNMTKGTAITITNSSGETIYSYTVTKSGNSIVFSSDKLKLGETYTVKAGEEEYTVTLSSVITTNGKTSNGGFGGGQMGGRGQKTW